MSAATGKKFLKEIDGTPEKRLFLSIISDYDLKTGLCELIDNAIDLWITSQDPPLQIDIVLDHQRQIIVVSDNAGGVREAELRLLIAPGASGHELGKQSIGTFGVGGKRAGVALGELVEIKSRHKKQKSLQLDINTEWLSSDNWKISAFEIGDIEPNTTSVEISKLRRPFDESDIKSLQEHIAETYSWFIERGCVIRLNKKEVKPITFEKWSYPAEFSPKSAKFDVQPTSNDLITVEITAGLIRDRNPVAENYGVYFYCNNRLIIKELRTRDVGYYISSEAGVPHPDASLCRAIVRLTGPAHAMPWNSSKSGLNFNHPAFAQLRPSLIQLVSYFSSLSRRWKNDWEGQVIPFKHGQIEKIPTEEVLSHSKIVLPKLPRVRKIPRIDYLKEKNKRILSDKPWALGLLEAMGVVEVITAQNLETKNRSALILLDSNFEIALKEFIVNNKALFPAHKYDDAKITALFKSRHTVISEVTTHVNFTKTLLGKVSHFYNLRNKLVHERATVGITDNQIEDYKKTIESVLKTLFGLKFPEQ